MNREEALRSLHIAQRHFDSSNYPSSIRFAKKSISLYSTPEAETLLAKAEELASSGSSATASASASGVDPSPSSSTANGGVKHRKAEQSSTAAPTNGGNWTPAQAAVVKRVKACKVTAYYDILSLDKSCSDADIKKAYRKLALGLHPDKNLAPGAEEAFKMVSKAFQVLSDGNKRTIYDQTGSDPDSRGGGGGGGGMGNFARRGGGARFGGGGFGQAEEMSPEDLFRFFFNGGGGGGFGGGGPMGGGFGMGGPFGGGGGFQFYGPGGIRMQTGGMGAGARAGQPQQPQTTTSTLLQIAPLLLFLFISVITQLPSLFGKGSIPNPDFSFEQTTRFPLRQETHSLHVPYYVNPNQFASHPIYASYLRANPSLGFQSPNPSDSKLYTRDLVDFLIEQERQLQRDKEANNLKKRTQEELTTEYRKFEKSVESSWINRLQSYCRHEINNRQDALDRARGFLGIGADYDKIRKLTAQKLPSCEALAEYGYSVRY
ncbi:uncharacterized protein JCM15063_000966 [Sporobolomyces koalae]|uniref:uncharacterized protein n=1 Tax=Sporobolomyces koalae TaxID=500713 RepID=UPI0031785557